MTEERFVSKRDAWLGAAFFVGVAGMAVFSMVYVRLPGPLAVRVPMVVLGALVEGLLLWVWFGTYYVLDASELKIRCGPFRWRVGLDTILQASPQRGFSGPILSTDAVFLRTDRGLAGGLCVSPARRDEFLVALAARAGLVQGGASVFYRAGYRSS